MNAHACVLVIRLHLLLHTGLVVVFQGWRGPEVIWSFSLALAEAVPQRSGRAETCHCGAGRFSSLFSPVWTPAFSKQPSLSDPLLFSFLLLGPHRLLLFGPPRGPRGSYSSGLLMPWEVLLGSRDNPRLSSCRSTQCSPQKSVT